jgi:peptide/nickel transport system permease protein
MQVAMNPKVTAEARERMRKFYELDKPLPVQYAKWVSRLARLDFGRSFMPDHRPVIDKVAERIPVTLSINIIALVLEFGLAMPIGILAAIHRDKALDKWTTVFVFAGFSAPLFWVSLILMYLFGIKLGWLPISGLKSMGSESFGFFHKYWDMARHLLLPIGVATFGSLAGVSRYMRTSMLDVLGQDYIVTARAKGLPERLVIFRHALKNALLPVVTMLGLSVPGLIGGSVIFEQIFSIPGMGKLFYDGVMARDYPLIMGILVIGAFLTLLGNLIADILYAVVDPRIRHR